MSNREADWPVCSIQVPELFRQLPSLFSAGDRAIEEYVFHGLFLVAVGTEDTVFLVWDVAPVGSDSVGVVDCSPEEVSVRGCEGFAFQGFPYCAGSNQVAGFIMDHVPDCVDSSLGSSSGGVVLTFDYASVC